MDQWPQYIQSKDFKKIGDFINNEFELFKSYFDKLNSDTKRKYINDEHKNSQLIREVLRSEEVIVFDQVLR